MKQKLINFVMFTTGAAIGSLVTWRLMKTYYEQYVQEEVDKFVEDWRERNQNGSAKVDAEWEDFAEDGTEDEEDEDDSNETEIFDYHNLAKKYGTPGNETENDEEGEEGPGFPYVNGPVVITPDEFGDGNYAHSLIYLTYYEDGVLANDWYEVINIEDTIGEEALEHFGDYANDVVHVRNEQSGADYEVVRDSRKFADVTADDPLMTAYAT